MMSRLSGEEGALVIDDDDDDDVVVARVIESDNGLERGIGMDNRAFGSSSLLAVVVLVFVVDESDEVEESIVVRLAPPDSKDTEDADGVADGV